VIEMTSTKSSDLKKTSVIETKSGKVQGYLEDELEIFKGIPFAEPPVGDLRFKAPVEKKPWNDVFDASSYGFCPYQGDSPIWTLFSKPEPESEDCLNLNVWTPATDSKKRPVMVWIYGGSFKTGSGIEAMYDGSHLSKRGDVVVVTLNYRLGALGFLYIPGLTVNAGLLDQVVALQWVHDNIGKFGGDPNNVTIFGESAGATFVCALSAMPSAKGLFNRVIAQSTVDIKDAKTTTCGTASKKLMRSLGLKKGDIEGSQKIPVDQIMEAQNKILTGHWTTNPLSFSPFIDGEVLPIHPLKAMKDGDCKDIDFLIGTNLEEFKLYLAMPPFGDMADEKLEQELVDLTIMAFFAMNANKFNEVYEIYKKEGRGASQIDILSTLITDAIFRIITTHYLEEQSVHQPNTFNYLFTMKSPYMNGRAGSCHFLEVSFVFGTTGNPEMEKLVGKDPDVKVVSEKMMDAWIAFARTGNPNAESIPEWPAYETEKRSTMVFGKEMKVVEKFLDKQREAWGDTFNI
jgi:para-nitrobenzyl esterase